MEDKPKMHGNRSKKSYKRFLSITLIILCGVSPIAPTIVTPGNPVFAQDQGISSLNSCSARQSFEGTMFAVTVKNTLLNFNPGSPFAINSSRPIRGLARNENVVG